MPAGQIREHASDSFIPADPPWCEVTAWADKRLAQHRRRLETIGMPPIETEGLRYAIAELNALLKFPNPSKISASLSEEPK